MGKKKKKVVEKKPYCWYCLRAFDDEKVLVLHQKAKHFKCHVCHKKLNSASGMAIHVFQVHKETISKVPNAKQGRDSFGPSILGMEGIPDEDFNSLVLEQGGGEEDSGTPVKKQKVEYEESTSTSSIMDPGVQGVSGAPLPPPGLPPPPQVTSFIRPPMNFGMPPMPLGMPPMPGMPMPPMHGMPGMPGMPPMQMNGMPMGMGMPPMPMQGMMSPMGNRGPININFNPNGNPPLFNPGPMNQMNQMNLGAPPPLFPIGMGLPPDAQNSANAQAAQSVLVYSDDDISMEEKRSELQKYQVQGKMQSVY